MQLVLDLFYENLSLTRDVLREEYNKERTQGDTEDGGIHVFYITKICRIITLKIGIMESTEMYQGLNDLRIKRNHADYTNEAFKPKKGKAAYDMASNIRTRLEEYSIKISK